MAKTVTAKDVASSPELIDILKEWKQISTWLVDAKRREAFLRIEVAKLLFPVEERKEGTNNARLDNGSLIKITQPINRSLDIALLDSIMQQMPEGSNARKLDYLITYKPEIVTSGFRSLSEEEHLIFAQAYVEKLGMPQLEVEFSADMLAEFEGQVEEQASETPAKKAAKKTTKKVAKKAAKKTARKTTKVK